MQLGDFAGADAIIKDREDRRSREKVAGMKSPGELMGYANNYLARKRAEGDKRPDAVLLNEGMDELLGRRGASAQRAATQAEIAGTNLYDKARDNVDKYLTDNYDSSENKTLRDLRKADRTANKKSGAKPGDSNYQDTEGPYKEQLYRKEEQRMRSGQQAQSSPAPNKGGSSKPRPSAAEFDKG